MNREVLKLTSVGRFRHVLDVAVETVRDILEDEYERVNRMDVMLNAIAPTTHLVRVVAHVNVGECTGMRTELWLAGVGDKLKYVTLVFLGVFDVNVEALDEEDRKVLQDAYAMAIRAAAN